MKKQNWSNRENVYPSDQFLLSAAIMSSAQLFSTSYLHNKTRESKVWTQIFFCQSMNPHIQILFTYSLGPVLLKTKNADHKSKWVATVKDKSICNDRKIQNHTLGEQNQNNKKETIFYTNKGKQIERQYFNNVKVLCFVNGTKKQRNKKNSMMWTNKLRRGMASLMTMFLIVMERITDS